MPTENQRIRLWLSALTIVAVCLVVGLLYWTVTTNRAAGLRVVCSANLCQINLALHYYHQDFGSLPPAYVSGPDGKPMHSWRVLVLRYLDPDAYDAYDFGEPWDGPNNSRLATHDCARFFQCPAGSQVGSVYSNYVAIVGPKTVFSGDRFVSFTEMPEPGVRDTILVVEFAHSDIQWMEPRDLPFDEMTFAINDGMNPSISSRHPGGANVITRNSIGGRWFPATTNEESLKNLVILNTK